MAFKATVKFDGINGPNKDKSFDIMKVSYSLRQETDVTGRPTSKVIGGTAVIQVGTSGQHDIFDWKADQSKQLNSVVVTFYSRTDESKAIKTVTFNKVYCTAYTESLEAFGDTPVNETVTISADHIDQGGVAHENFWPDEG